MIVMAATAATTPHGERTTRGFLTFTSPHASMRGHPLAQCVHCSPFVEPLPYGRLSSSDAATPRIVRRSLTAVPETCGRAAGLRDQRRRQPVPGSRGSRAPPIPR